jgi:glucan 1,3-beta-glucosidase
MVSFSFIGLLLALRFYIAYAAPTASASPQTSTEATAASSYWLSTIERTGTVAFGASGYQIFRNVQTFGAKGDGVTDDTAVSSLFSSKTCAVLIFIGYQRSHFLW